MVSDEKAVGHGGVGGGGFLLARPGSRRDGGAPKELPVLFGVKFGKVMPESEECEINNVGERAYEYTPQKPLRHFSDYILFATPEPRRVSQIRAVRMLDGDADGIFAETEESDARRFGRGLRTLALRPGKDGTHAPD